MKYKNEKVSVIIPVYNSEKFLKHTINSVLRQSYTDIEIIVVDDCSQDNSAKIVLEMQKQYSNIRYYKQKTNKGVALARNRGLELAVGRYVAFLDSDDLWCKDKIKKQLELMKKNNIGFCFTAIEMIDKKGEIIRTKRNVPEQVDYKLLLKNTIIPTSSVVIDRNIIGDFKMPLLRSGQDYATWLSILGKGITAYGINEAKVRYRVSNNSLSSNKFKSIKQVWSIQVGQEKIHPIIASFNTIFFIINALKKYVVH